MRPRTRFEEAFRVEAEALQPVAAEPHDTGSRHQVRGTPVACRRCEFEHLDRARAQRLAEFSIKQRVAPSAHQASHFPVRRAAAQIRE